MKSLLRFLKNANKGQIVEQILGTPYAICLMRIISIPSSQLVGLIFIHNIEYSID